MKKITRAAILLIVFFLQANQVEAVGTGRSRLTITITPAVFQVNLNPGESWSSSLKIINGNVYDLTLYASLINFTADENGRGTPMLNEDPLISSYSLINWVEISKKAISVPKKTSIDVPFSIHLPKNAPPGKHQAAIIIGNAPLINTTGNISNVSTLVSSFLTVNVPGEIKESGNIQRFRTTKFIYQKPAITLELDFKNDGNVILRPAGKILATNLWRRKHSDSAIDQEIGANIVLPNSTKKFTFNLLNDDQVWIPGIYQARIDLFYGRNKPQNVSRTIYFLIMPLKIIIVASIVSSITLFLIGWLIKINTEKALKIEIK